MLHEPRKYGISLQISAKEFKAQEKKSLHFYDPLIFDRMSRQFNRERIVFFNKYIVTTGYSHKKMKVDPS